MTSEQALPALPQTMALWRLEKLPQAELKARLRAAGLSEVGTKRLLAQRLKSHLQAQPPPSSESSGDESSERPSSSSEEEKSEETDSGEKRPRRKRTRARERSPAPARLSRSDLRSVKTLLRRHARKRSRSTRSATASSSYSDSSRDSSSSAPSSSRASRSRTPSTASGSADSSPSPRPCRGHRRGHRAQPRSGERHGHRHHRHHGHHGHRHDRRRHRDGRREPRQTGVLPPVPDRIKGRIRRGEFIELHVLLQANLTRPAREHKGRADDKSTQRTVAIADFQGWIEAWSIYAAVLASYYPHLAPRLFHYQHFMTLKSRSFQAQAWLRYDSEFRLKLAANGSWHYEAVDTELWASCFAADGLVASQPPPLACYSCGSSAHFYAACPHRRLPSSFRPTAGQKPDQARPPATGGPHPPASPGGPQQEPCFIYNDKGRCFRGQRCPYSHACTHCGGQHPKRGCPSLRT